MTTPKVLCIGYNGANNTGAEALLLADIVDYVADAITRLTFAPEAAGLHFHLVAPH